MNSLHQLSGRCHCGNISYTFDSPLEKTELPIRRCDCSFCTRQGATYTSHPKGRLKVLIDDKQSVQWYRYGSETAEALLCTLCGVFPLISSTIDERMYAVLNANSINGLHIDQQQVTLVPYVEHSTDEMLRKRQENWIPEVEIEEGTRPRGIDPSFF